jgi:hypothetical protein
MRTETGRVASRVEILQAEQWAAFLKEIESAQLEDIERWRLIAKYMWVKLTPAERRQFAKKLRVLEGRAGAR